MRETSPSVLLMAKPPARRPGRVDLAMDDDEVVLGHSTLGKAKLTRLRPSKAQAKSTVQQVPSSQEKTKLTGLSTFLA